MASIQRRSPVNFGARPLETETRNGYRVVDQYENEGDGPYLIDWSHRVKWDVQHKEVTGIQPWGMEIPESAGGCNFKDGILINRMNRTQASIWHIGAEDLPPPEGTSFTETTDATACLALIGDHVFQITEKLTAMDLADPQKKPPFLVQGPLSHVPCQVVVFKRSGSEGIVLWTCSRGYAHDMVHAVLEAGAEWGLRPAGETRLTEAF